MDIKERIKGQIAEMEAQLTAFVEDVNRQIAAQQGGIQSLRVLLGQLNEEAVAEEAAKIAELETAVGEMTVGSELEEE